MRQVSSERELTWHSNRQLAPLWCHYSLHIPLGESVAKIRTGNSKVFNLCADIFMQGRQVSSLVDFCSLSHLLLLHPLWNWPRIDIDSDQWLIWHLGLKCNEPGWCCACSQRSWACWGCAPPSVSSAMLSARKHFESTYYIPQVWPHGYDMFSSTKSIANWFIVGQCLSWFLWVK